MTDAGGTVQGGGLPPVTDEDIKPQSTETTKEAPKTDSPKAGEKQGTESQPKPDANQGEAKEKGPGPWDAELAKRGLNTPQVDAFLREVVQPYVTQLEQRGGGDIDSLFQGDVERATMANEMFQAFVDDPVTAYRELGELLGLSGVDGEGLDGEGDLAAGLDEGEDLDQPVDERQQYIDQLMQREREAEEDAQYQTVLQEVGSRFGDGFDPDLFTEFVLSSGGDISSAVSKYSKYHRDAPEADPAPPTLGGGATPPPEAAKYSSVDDALNAFLAEEKAAKGVR